MDSKSILIIVGIVLAVLLIWGFIGGNEAKAVGITCDFGLGNSDTLCWKWHTNALGEAQEVLEDFFNK